MSDLEGSLKSLLQRFDSSGIKPFLLRAIPFQYPPLRSGEISGDGKMDKRIGTITIIITNRASQSENVNRILSEFGDIIIARMGIPHAPKDLNIIALIVHASTDEIGALTGKLGTLTGVQVKSALTKA